MTSKTTARRAAPYTGIGAFARLDVAVIAVDFEPQLKAKGEHKPKKNKHKVIVTDSEEFAELLQLADKQKGRSGI